MVSLVFNRPFSLPADAGEGLVLCDAFEVSTFFLAPRRFSDSGLLSRQFLLPFGVAWGALVYYLGSLFLGSVGFTK